MIAPAAGFPILELLIGMAVGAIILTGFIAVFAGAGRTARLNASLSSVQETARVIGETIASDLMNAGYWGVIGDPAFVQGSKGTLKAGTPVAANDCDAHWYTDLNKSIEIYDDVNPFGATCVPASDFVVGTDILNVRYVDATESPGSRGPLPARTLPVGAGPRAPGRGGAPRSRAPGAIAA